MGKKKNSFTQVYFEISLNKSESEINLKMMQTNVFITYNKIIIKEQKKKFRKAGIYESSCECTHG